MKRLAVLLLLALPVAAQAATWSGLAYSPDPASPTAVILVVVNPDETKSLYALNMTDPQWGTIKGLFVPVDGSTLDVTSLPIFVTGNEDVPGVITVNDVKIVMPNGKLIP